MAWKTPDELKAVFKFDLADDASDEPIIFAQENAASDLQDALSADDYALGLGDEPAAGSLPKYSRIVNAHAFLSVAYLLLTATQIRRGGQVAYGVDENASVTVKYLTPKEKREERAAYIERAQELIASFSAGASGETLEDFPHSGGSSNIEVIYVF